MALSLATGPRLWSRLPKGIVSADVSSGHVVGQGPSQEWAQRPLGTPEDILEA